MMFIEFIIRNDQNNVLEKTWHNAKQIQNE
jgi:hypothetical protein